MVDPFEGHAVEIEHIFAIVDIGHTRVNLKQGAGSNGELPFYAYIHAVITRETSPIPLTVNHPIDSVAGRIVLRDTTRCQLFIYPLRLGERKTPLHTSPLSCRPRKTTTYFFWNPHFFILFIDGNNCLCKTSKEIRQLDSVCQHTYYSIDVCCVLSH